jgi:topoisomerase-4 subunit B
MVNTPRREAPIRLLFGKGIVKTIREFTKKNFDAPDIRSGLVAAISVKVQEPVFESQTKTKLGSLTYGALKVKLFVHLLVIFSRKNLITFCTKIPKTAEALQNKIQRSEKGKKRT